MAATDDIRLRFDHVSIAVKSIDRAYEFFAKYFPIKLRGAKSLDEQVSGSFYWQDFHLGGFVVELIEDPPGKPGFVTKFIERHGEGMHHLSIETDGLDKLVANLKAGGVRVVDEQKYDSGSAHRVHLAALRLRRADPVLAHAELGTGASEAGARRPGVFRSRLARGQGHRRRLQFLHALLSRHENQPRDSHQQFRGQLRPRPSRGRGLQARIHPEPAAQDRQRLRRQVHRALWRGDASCVDRPEGFRRDAREAQARRRPGGGRKAQLARRASIFHLAAISLRRPDPDLGRSAIGDPFFPVPLPTMGRG